MSGNENTSDISGIVTAIVAVVGLGLSIYNFYISRRDRRPALTAKISNGFLTYGANLSEAMLLLEIANPGEKKAIVNGVQVLFGKRAAVFPNGIDGTKSIPFELQSGENANFWTPLKEFARSLQEQGVSGKVKIQAGFSDAVGNKYRSKNLVVDINE